MSDEQQPELQWAPIPPTPSRAKRVWLVVGLAATALAIIGVLLFFFLPRVDAPEPGPSGTPTPSPTTTVTPIPSPAQTPTDEPTTPPVTTPPSTDPDIGVFRSQVSVWLDSAPTGLDIISRSAGQDAMQVIDTLQEDGQRLSDALPPASIREEWSSGVKAYADSLTALRSAAANGSGVQSAVDDARKALEKLSTIVGG